MKVTKLRINLVEGNLAGICGSNLFQYAAEAIEDENRYYYRIDNVTIEITEPEYNYVIRNSYLYYFSTALKLHCAIQRWLTKGINSDTINK